MDLVIDKIFISDINTASDLNLLNMNVKNKKKINHLVNVCGENPPVFPDVN